MKKQTIGMQGTDGDTRSPIVSVVSIKSVIEKRNGREIENGTTENEEEDMQINHHESSSVSFTKVAFLEAPVFF